MRIERRHTGRVLAVHDDRVLLLHGCDPARPDAGSWWFTVGGGCEPGESTAAAARREAYEEAGLVLPDNLGPVVLQRETGFEFDGVWSEPSEDYFLCRVSSGAVAAHGWTDVEQRAILGHRWWSLAELQATTETVYPEGLADLLSRLFTGATRCPASPQPGPGRG